MGCVNKGLLKSNGAIASDAENATRNCQIWCASLNLAEGKCCEWQPKENTCYLFEGGVVEWDNHYAAACTDGKGKNISLCTTRLSDMF